MTLLDLLQTKSGRTEDDLRTLATVLVPVLSANCDHAPARELFEESLGLAQHADVLVALLDWWAVVSFGADPATSLAHNPPSDIPPDIRRLMVRLLEVPGSLPALHWLQARAALEHGLGQLEEICDLEHYGASRLPNERQVWHHLQREAQVTLGALRDNTRAPAFEVDFEQYHRWLDEANIEENSRRWKEMVKRAGEFAQNVAHLVTLQHQVHPWGSGPSVTPLAATEAIEERFPDTLERVLLQPIVAFHAAELVSARLHDEMVEFVAEAYRLSSRDERRRLVELIGPVLDHPDRGLDDARRYAARLRGVHQQLEQLRGRIEATEGTSTSSAADHLIEAELALLEGEIDAAAAQLAVVTRWVEEEEHRKQRRETLEHLRGTVNDLSATVGRYAEPPELSIALLGVAEAESAGHLDDAIARAESLRAQLQQRCNALLTERIEEFNTEAAQLPGTDELLAEAQDLEGAERLGHQRLDDLIVRRDTHVDALLNDAIERLEELLTIVGDAAIDVPDRAALSARIVALQADAQRWSTELGVDLPAAVLHELAQISEEVERNRVYRWTAFDGEQALVEHLVSHCDRAFHFDAADVRRLYVALKAKPFAILAGLSGSGKSTLARLFAEAFGVSGAPDRRRFWRIAVRPDWIDQSEVLGFINPVSNRYQPGWLAEIVAACHRSPDELHVALVDEMNLAPVEQYLAEYLSAAEEHRSGSPYAELRLYAAGASPANEEEWAATMPFPSNLLMIGTVNTDETTRVLSERVLDRANVLQLSVAVSDDHHHRRPVSARNWEVPYSEWRRTTRSEPSAEHHEFLVDIAAILEKDLGIGLGVRSHIEMERYLANAKGVIDDYEALDTAVLQRVIPKLRGFKGDLLDGLAKLHDEFAQTGCDRSARVLAAWLDPARPEEDFLDGVSAFVGLVSGPARADR